MALDFDITQSRIDLIQRQQETMDGYQQRIAELKAALQRSRNMLADMQMQIKVVLPILDEVLRP